MELVRVFRGSVVEGDDFVKRALSVDHFDRSAAGEGEVRSHAREAPQRQTRPELQKAQHAAALAQAACGFTFDTHEATGRVGKGCSVLRKASAVRLGNLKIVLNYESIESLH